MDQLKKIQEKYREAIGELKRNILKVFSNTNCLKKVDEFISYSPGDSDPDYFNSYLEISLLLHNTCSEDEITKSCEKAGFWGDGPGFLEYDHEKFDLVFRTDSQVAKGSVELGISFAKNKAVIRNHIWVGDIDKFFASIAEHEWKKIKIQPSGKGPSTKRLLGAVEKIRG